MISFCFVFFQYRKYAVHPFWQPDLVVSPGPEKGNKELEHTKFGRLFCQVAIVMFDSDKKLTIMNLTRQDNGVI